MTPPETLRDLPPPAIRVKFYTVRDLAEMLCVSQQRVSALILKGRMDPPSKFPGHRNRGWPELAFQDLVRQFSKLKQDYKNRMVAMRELKDRRLREAKRKKLQAKLAILDAQETPVKAGMQA